jgi:hypothetical protein
MPAVTPGQPVAPGVVTNENDYPQWGVGGGTPGSAAGWKIVEAENESQKLTYSNQGYLTWFSSDAAAKAYVSSESSAYGSGSDPLAWLAKITGFSGTNFVLRAVKVIIGGVLLISGIIHLAGIDKDALGIASKAVIPA